VEVEELGNVVMLDAKERQYVSRPISLVLHDRFEEEFQLHYHLLRFDVKDFCDIHDLASVLTPSLHQHPLDFVDCFVTQGWIVLVLGQRRS